MKSFLNLCLLIFLFTACDTTNTIREDEGQSANTFDHVQSNLETLEKSKSYTLAILEQMPDSLYRFRPSPEFMSFSQHYLHSAIFSCDQVAGRLGMESPYKGYDQQIELDKEGTIHEVHRMYDFLEEVLESKSNEEMEETIDFGGEEMPVWRLFDIVENHSIHHRGYSLVYMRMNGVAPKGYLGW